MFDVRGALARGYAFPCAMCKKLWWGFERNLDQCKAAYEGKDCGGPVVNQAFPEYEGPMTRGAIAKHCFRCGQPAVEAYQTPTGYVGVCKRHLPTAGRLVELKRKKVG